MNYFVKDMTKFYKYFLDLFPGVDSHPRFPPPESIPGIPGTGPPPEFRLPPPIGGGSKNPAPGIPGAAPGLNLIYSLNF